MFYLIDKGYDLPLSVSLACAFLFYLDRHREFDDLNKYFSLPVLILMFFCLQQSYTARRANKFLLRNVLMLLFCAQFRELHRRS